MYDPSPLSLSPKRDQRLPRANDPEGIQKHLRDCSHANGLWHGFRCKAEAADSFLSGRMISILFIAGGLLAFCAYW